MDTTQECRKKSNYGPPAAFFRRCGVTIAAAPARHDRLGRNAQTKNRPRCALISPGTNNVPLPQAGSKIDCRRS